MQYELARKKLGRNIIIGLSIENINQAEQCKNLDVDYYGVGPIFATESKADAAAAIGITELIIIQKILAAKPCVAIGGINITNIADVKNTGTGVAVISAITQASNPQFAAQQLLASVNNNV